MSEREPDLTIGAEDFSGGFLDTPPPDGLPPNATPDAKNAVFFRTDFQEEHRVTMRRRRGARLLNPTAMTAATGVDNLWEFLRDGATGELIAICNGTLKKFDGVDTFTALTNGGGFTAGRETHACVFRNNLHVTDGLIMKRYDGTTCLDVGFIAPTAAPALAVAAGPGVTGTYEGFAVWIDATTEHQSSPSAITAATVFANQQRQWTKPAGAPPANVTHWRIYCRRTDTNEKNFFKTGVDQLVATATYTEAFSDASRRDVGPVNQSNDVPPVFAHMGEFNGYRIGFKLDSSDMYVSKQFDAESQHPKDVFPVGGRGESKPVRSGAKFGEEYVLRKPTKSYRLVGDRAPFTIKVIDSSYGGVSPESGQEIDGLWYDWDEQRGPYVTDLNSQWQALADDRIKATVAAVSKLYLQKIRAAHYPLANLMLWAVPNSTGRKHTILGYNYRLQRWIPPITGFEFTALTLFTTSVGDAGLYFGDEWGRVYELFQTDTDGVPSGTTRATITSATSGSLVATGAAFYTTGSGLAGMPVAVRSPAGAWQWGRVASNTADTLTLDTIYNPALSPVPDPAHGTWTLVVGGIEWYWDVPWLTGGDRQREKRIRLLFIEAAATSPAHVLEVLVRYDRRLGFDTHKRFTFTAAGLSWGVGSWGVATWGGSGSSAMRKTRIPRSCVSAQVRMFNYYPEQPFEIASYALTADWQRARMVASV